MLSWLALVPQVAGPQRILQIAATQNTRLDRGRNVRLSRIILTASKGRGIWIREIIPPRKTLQFSLIGLGSGRRQCSGPCRKMSNQVIFWKAFFAWWRSLHVRRQSHCCAARERRLVGLDFDGPAKMALPWLAYSGKRFEPLYEYVEKFAE